MNFQKHAWVIPAAIGSLFIGWGLHQAFNIPGFEAEHWAWLTADIEVIEYIKFWFRVHGLWTTANGVFIALIALTAFRKGEPWAWWVLAYLPVHIILLTIPFFWLFFITIPIALIAGFSLWKRRDDLEVRDTHSTGFGWMVLLIFGLALLYYAYDNAFTIPALNINDSERGWVWLTTDSEVIDYIKSYFRVLGVHVFGFGMLTILASVKGLRYGYRWAWIVLWLTPLLVSAHIFIWPWLVPMLLAILAIVLVGLLMPFQRFLPAEWLQP